MLDFLDQVGKICRKKIKLRAFHKDYSFSRIIIIIHVGCNYESDCQFQLALSKRPTSCSITMYVVNYAWHYTIRHLSVNCYHENPPPPPPQPFLFLLTCYWQGYKSFKLNDRNIRLHCFSVCFLFFRFNPSFQEHYNFYISFFKESTARKSALLTSFQF